MPRVPKVKISLMSEKAVVPSRAHDTDTGYDLTFTGWEKIEGDVIFFKTDIQLEPPSGHYFEVVPRSSISNLPLQMANSVGIIDQDYRGEVLVPVRLMHSQMGTDSIKNNLFPSGLVEMFGVKIQSMSAAARLIIHKKPTLFQMVLRKRLNCNFEVSEFVDNTDRGDGGFGSTDGATTESVEEQTLSEDQTLLIE